MSLYASGTSNIQWFKIFVILPSYGMCSRGRGANVFSGCFLHPFDDRFHLKLLSKTYRLYILDCNAKLPVGTEVQNTTL